MKMNKDILLNTCTGAAFLPNPCYVQCLHVLFYRFIEKPLLGVFVFAKRGKPLLPTKEAKKD